MKFGQHLQKEMFAPWRMSYISYDALKKDLKSRQLDHRWNENDEFEFVHKLQNELEKVYDFVSAKLSEIEARISYCERTIQTYMKSPTAVSNEDWTTTEDALTEVLFDVNDVSKFTRLNYIGFQKIMKKHDKWTGLNLTQEFIPELRTRPLDKQRFDVAIVFISALHDICKQRGKAHGNRSLVDVNPRASMFKDNKVKFWVHPDNVTEVKSIIMLHLPISIQNKQKRFDPSDCVISSVYLDNDQFNSYNSLLQKDEGAESICLQWNGPISNPLVFAERDSLIAERVDGDTLKDRIQLSSLDVNKFINRTLTAEEYANRLLARGTDPTMVSECKAVAAGIQKSIAQNSLKPMCRIFYNRTTFELPQDPSVCIHLDNDIAFIREDSNDGIIRRGPEEWRRPDVGIDYPFSYLSDNEISRFPYCVLEAQVRDKTFPQWLTKLLESHLVHEVPRFSKYLHCASSLFRDRIPLLPWWLSEMEVDIRKPRASNFGLTRSKSFKPLVDGQYRGAMKAENLRMEVVHDSTTVERESEDDPFETDTFEIMPNGSSSKPMIQSSGPQMSRLENRPHRMQSTLVSKGDEPLNYGPIKSKKKKQKPQGAALGEEVDFNQGDIRLNMDDDEKGARKIFGTNMYVKDPNDPNNVIAVKKVKVEPKVFFSNERTFISWLQFCALLLSVALNLLNFGDSVSRIAGALFIGISAGIAIYALYQFEKRAWMINRRIVGRYDDLWGPAVLCALLVGALIVNFYLRFR